MLIVVVDDHRDSGIALARLLTHGGFEATALSCGDELFKHLNSTPKPSLIILDLMMPTMDGLECLKKLRAAADWKDIPVIMYSADFTYERMQEARRLGAQDYVVKGTMRWDEFLAKIKRVIATAA